MTSPIRRRAAWLLLALSGSSIAFAWMLASPVGASPDEQSHIDYAWGTVTGQTVVNEQLVTIPVNRTATRIHVPQKLLQSPPPSCYAFQPQVPVKQCTPIPADNGQMVTEDSYMSRYPPLFYALEGVVLRAGTAADLSGPRVLYGARLAAVVLSLLAVGSGVLLLSRRFPGSAVMLATLLALPATAWFMFASVNPNGLEIAGAFLLAAGVLALRVDHAIVDHSLGARSVPAVLAVPIGTLLLAWTRPGSWVWAALILGLLLVPAGRRDGESWSRRLPVRRLGAVAASATVLVLASSMAWFAYAVRMRALEPARVAPDWSGLNPIERVLSLGLHTGQLVTEQIGIFGWLDTPLPPLAVLAWVSIAGVAAAIWAVGRNTCVPRWAVVALLGLAYLAAVLDEYRGAWGWQGRYLLPVTVAACVWALPGLVAGFERLTALWSLVPWMLFVLMSVQALSVVWFLFRNTYGIRTGPGRLPQAPWPVGVPSWTPPLGQSFVLALVAVALVSGVAGAWTFRPEPVSAADPERTDRGEPQGRASNFLPMAR